EHGLSLSPEPAAVAEENELIVATEPDTVLEEQFSQQPSPEKLAEGQMVQLPADLPAPAEVSDEMLDDTSPSDLVLRSVLKEAETLEKSRPRIREEEEVDSDGGHPPLSPARNLESALAAAGEETPHFEVRDDSAPVAAHAMSSMDFAIADDSDDAQHPADDEVQDDVAPVSGVVAVDSERARNLEEDGEPEPLVQQQPSASEALATGTSSLTGSMEGTISNAAAQGSDGSRTVQQAVVAAMFEAIDTNKDGVLSQEEFANFLTRPAEEGLTASPEPSAIAKDENDSENVPSMQALLAQLDDDHLEEHGLSLSPQPAAVAEDNELIVAAEPATVLEDDKDKEDVPSMQALLAQIDNDNLEEHQLMLSPEPAAAVAKEEEPRVSAEPAAVEEDRDVDAESSTRASDSAMLEAFLNAPPEELHGCWTGDISPNSRAQSARLWRQIRAQPLPPPDPEDNYEMSSQGEFLDMDSEELELHLEHLRAGKRSPRWSENYKEMVRSQADWDPDDVFGVRVPPVNLDQILPDQLYLEQKLHRSYKKRRGSSGKWEKDRLKDEDVTQYRSSMGHSKAWLLDVEALSAAARARQEGAMLVPESGSSNEYLAAGEGGMQDNVVHHEPESADESHEGQQNAERIPSDHVPEGEPPRLRLGFKAFGLFGLWVGGL
ncbi:unnamed protein product, partial [Symbiodinium sp. KB8]